MYKRHLAAWGIPTFACPSVSNCHEPKINGLCDSIPLRFAPAWLVGCQDPEPNGKLSEFASEFISLRLGSQNAAAMTGQPMINRSFQGLMSGMTGMPGGR